MDSLFLFYLGLLFSLGVFALKVALVLPLLRGYKVHLLIITFYSFLFYLFYKASLRFEAFILPLLDKGVYLHLFMASGLILWGFYLLFRPSCSHKALYLYLMPCPICLLSMSLSVIYFQRLGRLYTLSFWILPFSFIGLTYSFYLVSKFFLRGRLSREEEGFRWLGLGMLFSSLYLLGSFYFPQRFNEIFFSRSGSPIELGLGNQNRLWVVILIPLLISFLVGFFQLKSRRKL